MRSLATSLAVSCFVSAGSGVAFAASPDYCALYARELAKEFVRTAASAAGTPIEQRIQDQAFYKCLNMDEEPQLPQASAYADIDDDGGIGGPMIELPEGEGDAATAVEPEPKAAPAPPKKPVAAKKPTTKVASSAPGKRRGSGLEPWTPEWRAWCSKHFPNSFNANTGTILPLESNQRVFCK